MKPTMAELFKDVSQTDIRDDNAEVGKSDGISPVT